MTEWDISRREVVGGIAATALVATSAQARRIGHRPGFLAVGDWGRNGADHQRDVAIQMGRAATKMHTRFVVSVGDNFYPDGVASLSDPQWRTSFEDVYTAPSLHIPWYVALGNHDYHDNPQAQVDYTALGGRWQMPHRYYALSSATTGLPHTDIVVMDTTPFVKRYSEESDKKISANIIAEDAAAQLIWLDRTLAASTARRKLVVGHHTIMSGGSQHGPTPALVAQVKPLLEKHRVLAYINGHDHDMQHIRMAGVDYICCGAGSEVRAVAPVDGTLFCLSRSGFAAIALENSALKLEFTDYAGALVYRGDIGLDRKRVAA